VNSGSVGTEAGKQRDWHRIALWLVTATLAYNVIEAVVALWAGTEAESIALLGFGLDSLIEVAAAGVLLWRLAVEARGAEREVVERAERLVHRFIGATFIALALYVVAEAVWTLVKAQAPKESFVGIILAIASLIIMPLVALGEAARRQGDRQRGAEGRSQGDAGLLLSLLRPAAGARRQRPRRLVVGGPGGGPGHGALAGQGRPGGPARWLLPRVRGVSRRCLSHLANRIDQSDLPR